MVPLDLREVIFGRVGARCCAGGCRGGECECGESEEVVLVIEALRPVLEEEGGGNSILGL